MKVEGYAISHTGVGPEDFHGSFHEDVDGLKRPKLYRTEKQAKEFLHPKLFDGKGQPREDASRQPLVGIVSRVVDDRPDEEFEPHPVNGKLVHKRGLSLASEAQKPGVISVKRFQPVSKVVNGVAQMALEEIVPKPAEPKK